MALTNVTEAANLLCQPKQPNSAVYIALRQLVVHQLHIGFVVFDQLPGQLSLVGIAERVEQAAAQEAQRNHEPEQFQQPVACRPLDDFAAVGVAPGKRPGADVKFQFYLSLEGLGEGAGKLTTGMQPRYFPAVLESQ